jgi:hypothetical protein
VLVHAKIEKGMVEGYEHERRLLQRLFQFENQSITQQSKKNRRKKNLKQHHTSAKKERKG